MGVVPHSGDRYRLTFPDVSRTSIVAKPMALALARHMNGNKDTQWLTKQRGGIGSGGNHKQVWSQLMELAPHGYTQRP